MPPKREAGSSKAQRLGQKQRRTKKKVHRKYAQLELNKPPTDALTVLVFGNGECGELGLGPQVQEASRPKLNPFLDPDDEKAFHVVQVACGGMHTIALTTDNQIVTWGVNDDGALGRDTSWDGGVRDIADESDSENLMNPRESTPGAILASHFPPGTRFAQVAAGDSCSFALTTHGEVYGWGTFIHDEGIRRFRYDDEKRVVEKQFTPILIPGLGAITQVVCGINHVLALDAAGKVWAWGCGQQNQLGRRLFGRHQDGLTPRVVEVCRHGARYIASGDDFSFAVDRRDDVYAWGTNNFGQAGDAASAGSHAAVLPHPMKLRGLCGRGIAALGAGTHHAAAVTDGGECLAWGRIDGGQLGIDFTPEQIGDDAVVRKDEEKRPRICLVPTAVGGISSMAFVGAGARHTIFIDGEGVGYAAGVNTVGQLGVGGDEDVHVPTRLKGPAVKTVRLNWAGGGGQNSVVTGFKI